MNSCLLRISIAMLVAAMGIGWTTLEPAGAIPATSNPIRRRLLTDYHNGASSEYSLNPFRALRVVANVYVGTVVKRNDVSKDPVIAQYGGISSAARDRLLSALAYRIIKSIPNGGGITTSISKTGPVTSHHFTEGRSVATYQMLHALKQTVTQSWCAGRRKVLLPRTRQDLIAAMRRIRRLGKEPAAHDATLISAWLGKKHE